MSPDACYCLLLPPHHNPHCGICFLLLHACLAAGVGKTELAKALAAYLFNSEEAMVRLDMSKCHCVGAVTQHGTTR